MHVNARSLPLNRSFLGALMASALCFPDMAQGQEQPDPPSVSTITVGSTIRLRAPTVGRIEGVVIEMEEASLLVSTDDRGPLRVPRQALTQIEVSAGQRRKAVKGLILGAAIGGAAFGFGACCTPVGSTSASDRAKVVSLGLVVGATCGAAIGHLIKTERWRSLPLEQVRVSFAPSRGHGVYLSFALGF